MCELLLLATTSCLANNIYSLRDLLGIDVHRERTVTTEFLCFHDIPVDIARSPDSSWITIPAERQRRRRRERRQKRCCRAGVLVRLRRQPHKPPLPSVFLTNARSLANKMDELNLQIATNNRVKDSCILLITETWLHSSISDAAIKLADRTAHRPDRTSDSTISSHCSPDLEYVTVKCRPFYLPREFNVVIITAVYIPPDANASLALGRLHDIISSQQSMYQS